MCICPPWVWPERHSSGCPSARSSSAVRGPWASTRREPPPGRAAERLLRPVLARQPIVDPDDGERRAAQLRVVFWLRSTA